MWLRKTTVPGAAPGGLVWNTADDVVEVDDDLGIELLNIRGAGFVEAPVPSTPPAGRVTPVDDSAGADEPSTADAAADVVEAPPAKRRTARKATTEVTK